MDLLVSLGGLLGPFGVFVLALGALGLAAVNTGVDSRPGIGDDHQRPTTERDS